MSLSFFGENNFCVVFLNCLVALFQLEHIDVELF